MEAAQKARFDTRLSREQKEFFEYAASLGGFRSLTEFIMHSAQTEAKKIIEEHNQIISSKQDQEIFFDALMNPPEPNQKLKEASERYERQLKS